MKLKEKQGVTAGIVLTLVLTASATATALAEARTETLLKTLGACAISVGLVWFFIHKYNKAQDHPPGR